MTLVCVYACYSFQAIDELEGMLLDMDLMFVCGSWNGCCVALMIIVISLFSS